MIVVLVPVPLIAPGFMVHVPVAGKPFNTTDPVATAQVGWVIVPTVGAVGADGAALIVTESAGEIHPAAFFTVTL